MKLKRVLTVVLAVLVACGVVAYAMISSLDLDEVRARIEAEAKKATGRDLKITGLIDLSISLTPAVAVEDLRFANASWSAQPNMVTLDRLEIEIALLPLIGGDIQVNRLVLVGADIRLETNVKGEANWTFEPAEPAETAQPAAPETSTATPSPDSEEAQAVASLPDVREVEIRDSRVTFVDGISGESVSVALDEVTARRQGEKMNLDLAGSYRDIPFAVAGEVANLQATASGADAALNLRGKVSGAAFSLEGTVAKPTTDPEPDLKVAISGDSLADLKLLAGGADLPPLGPYSLTGLVTGSGAVYRVDGLVVKLAESDLGGSLSLDLSAARPKLAGDLTAALIDLSGVSGGAAENKSKPGDKSKPGEVGGAASPYVIPDTPLPLDALRAADAALSLKIGLLRARDGLEAQNLTLSVKLADGKLTAAPFSLGLAGGTINGNLTLDASRSPAALKSDVEVAKLDLGRLLKEQGVTDSLQANLDAKLALEGVGDSPRALAASLNGKTEMISEKGVISNQALAVLSAGLAQVIGPLFGGAKATTLNCVVSRFNIKKGLMTSRAMILDTSSFSIAGEGTLDLEDERMDMLFATTSRQPSLAALAVPFRVGGTLKSPSVTPDPVGTALKLGKLTGTVINPTAALSVLLGEGAVSGGGNPCLAALDKAAGGQTGSEAGGGVTQQLEGAGKGVEDAVKGIGEGLKGLFKKN